MKWLLLKVLFIVLFARLLIENYKEFDQLDSGFFWFGSLAFWFAKVERGK